MVGIEQLAKKVEGLSLAEIAETFPECHPEINPVHLYRAHLSDVLSGITGVDKKIVYPNLQWTQGLDKGDLVLAAPSLRIKGAKFDELAKEWADKVFRLAACGNHYLRVVLTMAFYSSRMTMLSFRNPSLQITS